MKTDALVELLAALGRAAPEAGEVELPGEDPVLQTRFRIGEAAAIALGAVGVAVSDIWELRTGRRQQVSVDVAAAAASLLSFRFQRVVESARDGGDPPRRREGGSVTGLYPARDGQWFLLHGSFPDTQRKALELLGCPPDRERVAVAIAQWDAQELEDEIAERGLCGARVRSAEEWAAHPQGRTLAAHAVVEVIRIGDSPPQPLGPAERPLEGIRALDRPRVLAGPTCGRTLAAHGAQVLRIGSPQLPSVPFFVMDTGHGKRSAHLHLKDPGEAERLRALVRDADVFTQGYRGDAMERLGFGPDALHELRPGLIYTSINCYGHVGEWRTRPGWEQLAQTVTGIANEHGGDESPRLLPAAATDYTTGYLAALGTLVALARRAREGGSYHVRASLSRSGMWISGLGRSAARGPGVDAAITDPLMTESETPYGRLRHLAPVERLSETPAHWARPTVPLGSHEPVWE